MPRDLPIGNGNLLANFDSNYQLRDIYWPRVGQQNHTIGAVCRMGISVGNYFFWLDDPGWLRSLKYEEDTLITHVRLTMDEPPLELVFTDGVDFHEDVLLRKVEVHQQKEDQAQVRLFFGLDLSIDGHNVGDSAYYEPDRRCLIHYKQNSWFLVGVGRLEEGKFSSGCDQWAVGVKGVGQKEGTWKDAEDGSLSGNSVAQGSVDSVLGLHLMAGNGSAATGYFWLAAGRDHKEVCRLNHLVELKTPDVLLERTRNYWTLWADKEAHHASCISDKLCGLYRRSLLTLRTQIDNGGAILAANDFDIAQFNRDTYSYMWPRDGALVIAGLIDSGYSEISRRFFDFCHRAITDDGYLLHKYNPDGSLASSWHGWTVNGESQLPVQQDETALVLWALWRHFDRFRDIEFIKHHYRGLIIRAANWLTRYRCGDCFLPLPSWDLWEERHGVHAWTVGAVWAGLAAAARFAEGFGEMEVAGYYRETAEKIKLGVGQLMWLEDESRFCRTLTRDENGGWQQDRVIDASLHGLWYFGMIPIDDPRLISTMDAVRQRLWVKTEVGGIARYENDYYHQVTDDIGEVPGNPWFICTLWLAQYEIARATKRSELNGALELIEWCARRALASGVMAEQVHPYTNEPLSVSPLTWSHATLVATINEFLRKDAGFPFEI